MKVMKVSGSLTASAGGALPLRRRRRLDSFGSTASSVATAMARSTDFFSLPMLRARTAARSSPGISSLGSSSPFFLRFASLTASRLFGPRTGVLGVKIQPTPGHRLAPDQASLVEEPLVLAVELLERVVRQHHGPGLVGDAQEEGVAPADGPGGRRHHLAGGLGLLVRAELGSGDPMGKGGVDHDGHDGFGILDEKLPHGLVQLGQARRRAPFGRDI